MKNNIFIASDHAGFNLKQYIIQNMSDHLIDLGTDTEGFSVNYPDYAQMLCNKLQNIDAVGILICGSGIGMSIAANRFSYIRAALCHSIEYAELARKHNNANVLVLGSRFISNASALEITKAFLTTQFDGGRHLARLLKISSHNTSE